MTRNPGDFKDSIRAQDDDDSIEVKQSFEPSPIKRISVNERRSGILFKDVDALFAALGKFSRGDFGLEATNELIESSKDPRAQGLLREAIRYTELESTKLTSKKIMDEIRDTFDRSGRFDRRYDYDAFGTPFFKTTVIIEGIRGSSSYSLTLRQQGDSEEVLAKAVHSERGFTETSLSAALKENEDDMVFVDFDALADRLTTAFVDCGAPKISGTEIADALYQGERSIALLSHPFYVTLAFTGFADRIDHEGTVLNNRWVRDGNKISCPLAYTSTSAYLRVDMWPIDNNHGFNKDIEGSILTVRNTLERILGEDMAPVERMQELDLERLSVAPEITDIFPYDALKKNSRGSASACNRS